MDGPNVHFGEHNSVSTILKIPMTRDFSHCSALAVTHHTKGIIELLRVKELMMGIKDASVWMGSIYCTDRSTHIIGTITINIRCL